MGLASVRDEARHHVDARHVDAERLQVCGPMARPAAEIQYATWQPRQVLGDESRVVFVGLPVAAEQVDVLLGHVRVGIPHGSQAHPITRSP
jgi:hypothetical protein